MRKFIFVAILFFVFPQISFSQSPTPTPSIDKDVVKISTTLIQVDVTVTDKKEKIVRDLTPEDFEIYENDQKQKISDFSFVSSVPDEESELESEIEKLEIEAPPPVKELKPNEIRRTIAIVVDDISLSAENVNFVKQSLKKFVAKQLRQGDLVAIILASAGLGTLQQFTANKSYLYASIEQIKWKRRGGKLSSFDPFSMASGALDPDENRANRDTSESDADDFRKSVFAAGTLGAIKYVIDGMEKLPGRKSIMVMSEGIQIFARGDSGFNESTRVSDVLKSVVDLANQSSVVIYTMDTRGLETLGFTAADDLGSRPIYNPTDLENQTIAITQDKTEKLSADRRREFYDSQEGLSYLAKETGGIFIKNSNNLYGGIKKMLDDQSYYLIAYEPDAEKFDPEKNRFNKLDIKVNRKDVDVRYRSGFFGTSDDGNISKTTLTPNARLNNALISPFPVNDVNIKLTALFQGNSKNKLFINSLVFIDISSLAFTESGPDRKKAVFDLLAASFDESGFPTDQQNKTFTLDIKNDIYERMLKEGFIYYFTLPIKKDGTYQMRVAILDKTTDKIGSTNQIIGIPKLKNKEIALSGIALDNMPFKIWNNEFNAGTAKVAATQTEIEENLPVLTDSAVRKFKRGTILRYGLEVYNPQTKKKRESDLNFRVRIFNDNKILYDGTEHSIEVGSISKKDSILISGALNLGGIFTGGDYVLQIIVTEKLNKKNKQVATQFVQFEVTK